MNMMRFFSATMSGFWWLTLLYLLSGQQTTLACYQNIRSNGVTSPSGDIFQTAGSELVINCTLNTDYNGSSDSRDITWKRDEQFVADDYVSILDTRSAQLRIQNLTSDQSGNYICLLRSTSMSLCMNSVSVGYPPRVLGFMCRSQEWQNMTCSWQAPKNTIPTEWKLTYTLNNGIVNCPKYIPVDSTTDATGCFFDIFTRPPYRPAESVFNFTLTGSNAVGRDVSWNFKVDHFSIVLPSRPINVKVSSYGSTGLNVIWQTKKAFRHFPAGLVYQLSYQSQWDSSDFWNVVTVVNRTSYLITGLVPFTNYTIKLRCRSETAADIPDLWSDDAAHVFSTKPDVPVAPINCTPSSFEDINIDMDKRNVTIFWQSLPPFFFYGPDFHYLIGVYSEGRKLFDYWAASSDFSKRFSMLNKTSSYLFKIRASNRLGVSNKATEIFVPQISDKTEPPDAFTVIFYGDGVYELSWKPSDFPPSHVSTYTVFSCKALRPRMDPCSNSLNWTTVSSAVLALNITVPDVSSNYKFAVSSGSGIGSSGLVWSKCIVPYNGVLSKMKRVSVKAESARSIRVMWWLDCSDRLGILIGFEIKYCLCDKRTQLCKDKSLRTIRVNSSEIDSYTVEHLDPDSTYRLSVAAVTMGGVGEPCDEQLVTTDQAAPDDPPQNVTLVFASNQSIAITWETPEKPNGVLTNYSVTYDMGRTLEINGSRNSVILYGIQSYTNYSVTVKACTVIGCSPASKPLLVTTRIGVPGIPEAPKARLINATHMIVEWEEPVRPNGPISNWDLLVMQLVDGIEEDNHTYTMQNTSRILPVDCHEERKTEYLFAVRAVNRNDNGENLIGLWSETSQLNACFSESFFGLSSGVVVSIVLGGTFALTLLALLFFYAARIFGNKIREMRKLKVVLPGGLAESVPHDYSGFEKSIGKQNQFGKTNHHDLPIIPVSVVFYDRLQSVSSDEGRSSQDSAETTLHVTSSLTSIQDENLYLDKMDSTSENFQHVCNLSGDSSGCSSGDGSVSSSLTTRTHLSSDSGAVKDEYRVPGSPDSVFLDSDAWHVATLPASSNFQLRLRSSNPQRNYNGPSSGSGDSAMGTAAEPEVTSTSEAIDSATSNVPTRDDHFIEGGGAPPYSKFAVSNEQRGYWNAPEVVSKGASRPEKLYSRGAAPINASAGEFQGTPTSLPYSCLGLANGVQQQQQPCTRARYISLDKTEPIKADPSPHVVQCYTTSAKDSPKEPAISSVSDWPDLPGRKTTCLDSKLEREASIKPNLELPLNGGQGPEVGGLSPSYVTVTMMDADTGCKLSPGYSKIARPQTQTMFAAQESMMMAPVRLGEMQNDLAASVGAPSGYVSVGVLNSPKKLLAPSEYVACGSNCLEKGMLGASSKADDDDDGVSWEAVLDEENVTEEELRYIEQGIPRLIHR